MSTEDGGRAGGSARKVASIYLFSVALSLLIFQSLLMSMFTPLPQMYCYLRLGRWAGLSIPLVLFVIFLFTGMTAGLSYLLQFGLPGIIISEAILRKQSVEKGFLLALSISTVLALLLLGSFASRDGVTSGEVVKGFVEKAITQSIALNEKAGGSKEQLETFKSIAPAIGDVAANIYPSLMIAGLMITIWLNLMVLTRYLKHKGGSAPFGELSRWKAPEHLVWGVVAGGISLLSGIDGLRLVGINLIIVLFLVYFFQGMAVISYYFNKKGASGLLKGIVYLLIIWYMSVVVAVIGLFDIWADFRKLSTPKGHEA